MSKAIDSLKAETSVLKEFTLGRYTLVQVQDAKGMKAVGLSRCSEDDTYSEEKGKQIAHGKALRSLLNKRKGVKSRYWCMG